MVQLATSSAHNKLGLLILLLTLLRAADADLSPAPGVCLTLYARNTPRWTAEVATPACGVKLAECESGDERRTSPGYGYDIVDNTATCTTSGLFRYTLYDFTNYDMFLDLSAECVAVNVDTYRATVCGPSLSPAPAEEPRTPSASLAPAPSNDAPAPSAEPSRPEPELDVAPSSRAAPAAAPAALNSSGPGAEEGAADLVPSPFPAPPAAPAVADVGGRGGGGPASPSTPALVSEGPAAALPPPDEDRDSRDNAASPTPGGASGASESDAPSPVDGELGVAARNSGPAVSLGSPPRDLAALRAMDNYCLLVSVDLEDNPGFAPGSNSMCVNLETCSFASGWRSVEVNGAEVGRGEFECGPASSVEVLIRPAEELEDVCQADATACGVQEPHACHQLATGEYVAVACGAARDAAATSTLGTGAVAAMTAAAGMLSLLLF